MAAITVPIVIAAPSVAHPGDKIILTVPPGTTHEVAAALHQQAVDVLPGIDVVVIAATSVTVVRKDEQ